MPLYESTFIMRHDMSAADTDKLTSEMAAIIKDNGGKIVKTENWGLRTLAYRIHKARKGHYVFLGLDAPAPAIREMERKARLNEDIVRNLTVKVDQLPEGETAPLQEAKQ